jgi:hypothetical protein
MPPKEFRPFTDSERVLQSKTVTLAWQKRALNTRVHQGVADLAAFLSDFRKLLHYFSVCCPSGTPYLFRRVALLSAIVFWWCFPARACF